MNAASEKFFQDSNHDTYISKYSEIFDDKDIEGYPLEDFYILDVVKNFGKQKVERDDDNNEIISYEPIGSTLYKWNEEYSIVSRNADRYMSSARGSFENIFSSENFEDIKGSLSSGKQNLDKLTKPFTDAEKEFGTLLGDYSGHIDKYGKMSVTIVFSILMIINIALAVLMLLIYFFSTKTCAGYSNSVHIYYGMFFP